MLSGRKLLASFLLLTSCFLLLPSSALAVDATWLNAPASADWNSGTNWSGGVAPVNAGDTATFGTSTQTSPTLSTDITISSITFIPGASAFSIQVTLSAVSLNLQGAGIVNNSGNVQTINNSGLFSFAQFLGTSTAGNATINNSASNSFADFFDSATAGNATINNSAANSLVRFFDTSSAANATINNNSFAGFFDSATAGNATINNSGAESIAFFFVGATAANATIVNSGDRSFSVFAGGASGGSAALINANPTAFITIAELDGTGTTFGSIAGNGAIFLGSKNLNVGGTQQSTIFSGVISDGESPNLPPEFITGQPSYVGGSLTKVGSGTLTLTGGLRVGRESPRCWVNRSLAGAGSSSFSRKLRPLRPKRSLHCGNFTSEAAIWDLPDNQVESLEPRTASRQSHD